MFYFSDNFLVYIYIYLYLFSDNYLVFYLYFYIFFVFYAILHVFVLYSHYGYSILNEKLNGYQAFNSLGLLGALTFLFKQHTSL